MDEIIALENTIREALPAISDAAERDDRLRPLVAFAHDILCNGWTEEGSRLDRLRTIARSVERFAV